MSTATVTPLRIEWHPMPPRTRYAISLAAGAGCLVVASQAHTALPAGLAAAFAFGSVAALADQRVTVYPQDRQVAREITLLGCRISSSRWPLESFTAVRAYRLPAGTPQAPGELFHVSLQRASGTILAVKYFAIRRGAPCPEGEAFAQALAQATGLSYA